MTSQRFSQERGEKMSRNRILEKLGIGKREPVFTEEVVDAFNSVVTGYLLTPNELRKALSLPEITEGVKK